MELYELYKTARNYITESFGIEPVILIELIKSYGLDMRESLEDIPFLHSGYLSVIQESWKTKETEDGNQFSL